jgi:hypothetical protein
MCAVQRQFCHWLLMWFGSSWSTSSVRTTDRYLAFRGGSADAPSTVCSDTRGRLGGPEVSGCSDGLVGRRSDIGGGVDQAAAGWFGERDDLVGRELIWSHPPHSLKPGLALFDGDLGFALGSHGDQPGWSSQTTVIGSDLAGDVGQLDAGKQASVQGHNGCRQVNPARDLVRGRPPGLVGNCRADAGPKLAGCLNQGRIGAAGRRGELSPAACRAAPRQLGIL